MALFMILWDELFKGRLLVGQIALCGVLSGIDLQQHCLPRQH